jgi:hypothetical protein
MLDAETGSHVQNGIDVELVTVHDERKRCSAWKCLKSISSKYFEHATIWINSHDVVFEEVSPNEATNFSIYGHPAEINDPRVLHSQREVSDSKHHWSSVTYGNGALSGAGRGAFAHRA